jgi:hypothetical protein
MTGNCRRQRLDNVSALKMVVRVLLCERATKIRSPRKRLVCSHTRSYLVIHLFEHRPVYTQTILNIWTLQCHLARPLLSGTKNQRNEGSKQSERTSRAANRKSGYPLNNAVLNARSMDCIPWRTGLNEDSPVFFIMPTI